VASACKPARRGAAPLSTAEVNASFKRLVNEPVGSSGGRSGATSTALHAAACGGGPRAVEWLLRHGADANARESGSHAGNAPLHAAVGCAKPAARAVAPHVVTH
jgi:hypothetical protein